MNHDFLLGKCSIVYGPVRSRRFGRSLGINLGDPDRKFCSWNCLYCQFGTQERSAPPRFTSGDEVLQAVTRAFADTTDIDAITLAGNTEPTLSPYFVQITEALLNLRDSTRAAWRIHCLTNGAKLDRAIVADACDRLDATWVKLDCAEEELFRRLNGPMATASTLEDHFRRIRSLKRPRIQTLLWKHQTDPALQNWTTSNAQALLSAYAQLRPEEVHVTTVERPTEDKDLSPVRRKELEFFRIRAERTGINTRIFP